MWDRTNDETLEMAAELVSKPSSESDRGLLPGDRIGPYEIVREIGRGGMAEVYHAARADDLFEQSVALKILQPGRVSRLTVERFEQERQIVASLKHPNIAGLLDGGVTDDGRPYFAMELVEGRPLDEYCDHHRLSIGQRLQLFSTVGRAVHYAHQNLWVHRDLKPANILVTDDGQVKLLDFGIAKLIEAEGQTRELPRQRARSAHQTTFWMTPQYASPEQLEGAPITTAADQYQLGLILFELLSGRLPYDLSKAPLVDVIRIVCEEQPPPPSSVVQKPTRTVPPSHSSSVSGLARQKPPTEPPDQAAVATTVTLDVSKEPDNEGESLPAGGPEIHPRMPPEDTLASPEDLAGFRRTTPSRLRRRLKGDLDAVVLRSLRKDPRDRYGSVEQLLDDLDLHLGGRPVKARSGVGYRARRFFWRNRWAAGALILFLAALIHYAFTVSRQSLELAEERDRAQIAAVEAEQVKGFLIDLFELADPTVNPAEEITLRMLLERGSQAIESELRDQPAVRAEMLYVIGRVHHRLGDYDKAQTLLTEALELRRDLFGPQHIHVAQTLNDLAMLYKDLGSYRRSESVHREVLDIRRSLFGREHPKVAGTLHNLAKVLEQQAAFVEAERYFREALAMDRKIHGTDLHRDVSYDLNSLGELLLTVGRLDEAEGLFEKALSIRRELFGADHPTTAKSRRNLARLYRKRGRLELAEQSARSALAIHSQALGSSHKDALIDLHVLGMIAWQAKDLARAREHLSSAATGLRQLLTDDHRLTITTRSALGAVLIDLGQSQDGLTELTEAVARVDSYLPADHPDTADIHFRFGRALTVVGRAGEARAALLRAEDIYRRVLGEEHDETRAVREWLRRSG